jgi:4-amino-4-deoxy-L-arabinose transferase-like glycosyltransferase
MTPTTPLVLLLPLAFTLIFLILRGHRRTTGGGGTLAGDFLLTCAMIGALTVLISELLGLFDAITTAGVALSWVIVTLALLFAGLRRLGLQSGLHAFRGEIGDIWRANRLLLVLTGSILLVLLLVGLVSPANNVDVMQYHMPRVMQWAQNQNLDHFATIYDNQNTRPYWAELGILHLRTLWGTDAPASLVQWFGLFGSMIAGAGIVRLLGKGRLAQWAAALFMLALPMGVLQATTPKNDIVTGFWTLSLLYFVVLSKQRQLSRLEWLGLGLSLGLGMLSKGTFLPFAFPIMVWFFLPRIFGQRVGRTALEIGILIGVMLVVNGAFWARNISTYGGPYGSRIPVRIPFISRSEPPGGVAGIDGEHPESVVSSVNISREMRAAVSIDQPGDGFAGSMIARAAQSGLGFTNQMGKLARMAAMHWTTPVSALNKLVFRVLGLFPGLYPEGFIHSLEGAVWNYAMTSGNPLHFLLLSLAMVGALASMRAKGFDLPAQMVVVALAGYGLISFGGCSDWIVCMRYQFPFFVIGGVVLGAILPERWPGVSRALIGMLVIYTLPYVFINNMRPVIGMKPWPTRIDSVFTTPKEEILFAHIPNFRDEYAWVADQIGESQCGQVGLYLEAYDFEYPFWWLLDVPNSEVQLQHVHPTNETARYWDTDFIPCAVICTICGGQDVIYNLPLVSDFGHVQYFSVDNQVPGDEAR